MKPKFKISSFIFFVIGTIALFLIKPVYASTGGPDTYGYTYSDSNSSAVYSWISHTGAATTVAGRGDDTLYGPYNMGFTFNFYGNDYTTFYICNNGYVTFDSGSCSYNNADIVTSAVPNNFIAPYWDDLYTGGTIKYELFGTAPDRYMVISFEGINHINYQSGDASFQVVLYETNNKIKLQYSDVILGNSTYDSGASATVGIENSAGTDGLKFSYNTASLSNSFAIEYTWPTPSLNLNQSAYRFFENANGTDVGSALATANTATTLNLTNQQFRLRMLLHISGVSLSQNSGSFKLQYVGKGSGSCSSPSGGTPSSWTDVSSTTDMAFYDNATPTDGSALTANGSDPTHNADTVVNQTYVEANNFSNSQALISSSQDGKWDFSLYDKTASANTTYCFRAVKSDGTLLDTYSVYPEITTKSTSGGPDTYGYRWNDNYGSGDAYNWNDISATGTEITGRTDDGQGGPYNIGFTFNYYGNDKTQFYFCNNGYISFSGDTCAYTNATIVTSGTPNDMIAPFWDDLYTSGHVYYSTTGSAPNRQLIVSYDGINPYSSQSSAISFQIILYESTNKIKLQYQDVDYGSASYGGGIGATAGIENSAGTDGLLYSFNQAKLSNNYAITFSTSAPYNQSAYRFFTNADSTTAGASLAAQDTSYTLTTDGQAFRLRMLIHNLGSSLGTNGETFKLQYVDKGAGTCASPSGSSPSSWTDITPSTALAYKDNSTPTDGSALTAVADDPTHSGHTVHNQTYEESNDFTNSQSTIPTSEDGMWDFALYDNSVSGASTFCLRAITSTGKEFSNYNSYPQITTAAPANSLTFSLSTTSIDLGTLNSSATTAPTSSTISVTSNASNGFQIYIKGTGNGAVAGLYDSAHSSLISATASSSVVDNGSPGFGVYLESPSSGVTIDEGFDNDSVSDLTLTTSLQKAFYTTSATGSTESANLRCKAVINSIVAAGTYSEFVDVIAFGSF